MAGAETFVHEMETKNLASFERLLAAYAITLTKEDFSPADLLRLEMKATVEAIEVSALWITETDSLDIKVALAAVAGDGARNIGLLRERLAALGVDLLGFDARFGGYTKLFAFFRSLQTTEERASAGPVTLRAFNMRRLELQARHCEAKGDPETAAFLRETLSRDEENHRDVGRRTLLDTAINEESQARARRAAFRTIELLGEVHEPSQLRKFLTRSLKR
jgi:hypothetical protein